MERMWKEVEVVIWGTQQGIVANHITLQSGYLISSENRNLEFSVYKMSVNHLTTIIR
jgi:hypothetical protein